MPDTSSKKMEKSNVVYPHGGGHAVLGAWTSVKGNLEKMLLPLVEGDLGRIKTKDADDLIREAIAVKEAKKDTYFKIGLIGSELVLRVKSKDKGIAQILGYDQKDALLLKGCSLKAAGGGGSKATEKIKFASFIALAPGDCPAIVNEYLDIGSGMAIKLELEVEGADKDSGLRARVTKEHERFCDDYKTEAKKIVDDVGRDLAKLTVKSRKSLQEVADDAEKRLADLFDAKKIDAAFEKAVTEMIAKDSNLKQHVREWKIKTACSAITTTVKLTTAVLRLVASHGGDVTAYGSIVTGAYAIYKLVDDFFKTEEAAAAALDKSIDLYQRACGELLTEVKKVYDEGQHSASTKLEKIKAAATAAGDAATMLQDKLTAAIKKFTGKDLAQQPEDVRRRYLVELGKLLNALDAQYKKLDAAIEEFKDSSISEAVKAWPDLQALKKACQEAQVFFEARQAYAEDAKAKIEALNIEVDDSTTLDKLKVLVDGVRSFDKDKVIGGAGGGGTVLSTLATSAKAVADLSKAVKAFV